LNVPKKGAKAPKNEDKPLKPDGQAAVAAADSDDGPFAALKRMIKGS